MLTGGSVADAVGTFRYTALGGGRIAPEQSWVGANIRTAPVPILFVDGRHQAAFLEPPAALTEIQQRGLADEIHVDEYAGVLNPRFIAGTQQLSPHPPHRLQEVMCVGNQRGTVGKYRTATSWTSSKKWASAWGGDWVYTDPMHFEMNAIVDPD